MLSDIPNTPFRYFWFTIKPFWKGCLGMLLWTIFVAAFSASSSYFFKLIVDAIEQNNYDDALFFGILYPIFILVAQLLWRSSGVLGILNDARILRKSYDNLASYISFHSHNFYNNRFAGSILNKISNIVGSTESLLAEFWWTHTTFIVQIIVSFTMMFFVSKSVGFLLLALVVTLSVIDYFLSKVKITASKNYAASVTSMKGHLADVIGNMSTVRQYAGEFNEQNNLTGYLDGYVKSARTSWFATEKILAVNVVVIFIFALAIFWRLTELWGAGAISAGDFVLVIGLMSQIYGQLVFLGRAFNNTAKALGEVREGLQDLIVPYDIVDKKSAVTLGVTAGQIDWQDVSFNYEGVNVFQNFDLKIEAGTRVGLVGVSGAGKSTFTSLLLRQFDIESGHILIDGQDIASVTQRSLRENIAMVPQEPVLFHRTIRENIRYGKLNATDEDVEKVAKLAYADEFIKMLPNGYDTLVGERGVKLSGGQRQRIAIARAIIKDAPILILDEATSALDSENEGLIQKALHQLMVGKTVIAIAHRLSTLREMDRIIVLEEGKIVEDGSHDSLLKYDGVYAKLWKHQAGGFLN